MLWWVEEETDLRIRWLMEDIYGRNKPPTPLPTTPYAGRFIPETHTNLTKLFEDNKGN